MLRHRGILCFLTISAERHEAGPQRPIRVVFSDFCRLTTQTAACPAAATPCIGDGRRRMRRPIVCCLSSSAAAAVCLVRCLAGRLTPAPPFRRLRHGGEASCVALSAAGDRCGYILLPAGIAPEGAVAARSCQPLPASHCHCNTSMFGCRPAARQRGCGSTPPPTPSCFLSPALPTAGG